MRYPVLPAALVLAVFLGSCGPGQPTYLDRVKPLPAGRLHPLVQEVLPLLEKPQGRDPDALMRTWKEFLGDAPQPLRADKAVTFVYYDFSRSLDQVFLEASFAPQRLEPLSRIGSTALFTGTYEVPRIDRLRYRFTDGKTPLADPFFPEVTAGGTFWHEAAQPTLPALHQIVGSSETGLAGQDLTVLLPPSYRRNLAWTYPLLVTAGLPGDGWTDIVARMMRDGSIRHLVAVSLAPRADRPWTAAELKTLLEDRVVPWLRARYRVSPLPVDLVLAGWGPAARPAQEVAASRPDFWTKTWTPLADQAQGEEAWNLLAPPYLRVQFGAAKP